MPRREPLQIDDSQRKRLRFLADSGKTPQKLALRARVILLASEGMPNHAIAARLETTRPTVLLWRERFAARGVPGLLKDAPRPGRHKAISPEVVKRVVDATLHTTPRAATHCAAIPKDLIESELFGYRRGAFSGANTEYLGLFRAAEGGTLFLDEIPEMGAETQSKLLRAIQERSVRPVGATREIAVDVRLIASTNRDPEAAVRSHVLREDLYYRLQTNVLRVPPLRDRLDDLPLLVDYFITLLNKRLGRGIETEGIEQSAMMALSRHTWPGNVRELANAIEGAMTFGTEPLIRLENLPPSVTQIEPRSEPEPRPASGPRTFAEVERDLILRALEACEWNKMHAATMLKISRKKLYAKINKYGLSSSGRSTDED